MQWRIAAIVMFAVGAATLLPAQTQKELDARYPATSYEVLPSVLMTPKYAEDDLVCEMTFRKSPIGRNGKRTNGLLDAADIEFIRGIWIMRGPRVKPLNGAGGVTNVNGDVWTTKYDYENAVMTVSGKVSESKSGATAVFVKEKNKTCKQTLPNGKRERRAFFNLLPGYKMEYVARGLEGGMAGDIWKEGGPKIHFVFDLYSASAVGQVPSEKIVWRKEQIKGVNHFVFVYTRDRDLVADFSGYMNGDLRARIENDQELAEVLLTILSLDTVRGYPWDSARMDDRIEGGR